MLSPLNSLVLLRLDGLLYIYRKKWVHKVILPNVGLKRVFLDHVAYFGINFHLEVDFGL